MSIRGQNTRHIRYDDQRSADIQSPSRPGPSSARSRQRELVRFFRQRNRVFGALGQPIIFWLLFGAGLQREQPTLDYAHFFPGTLVMILLFTAIFATISIIEDRREGFLQGVLVAPVPRWSMVLGKVLGGAAIAMLQGLVFLLLGWLADATRLVRQSSPRRRLQSDRRDRAHVRHLDRPHGARLPRSPGGWIRRKVSTPS